LSRANIYVFKKELLRLLALEVAFPLVFESISGLEFAATCTPAFFSSLISPGYRGMLSPLILPRLIDFRHLAHTFAFVFSPSTFKTVFRRFGFRRTIERYFSPQIKVTFFALRGLFSQMSQDIPITVELNHFFAINTMTKAFIAAK